jgi:hypothetical protein
MPATRDRNRGMVVAREAIVINVGARAPNYEQVEVVDRRTGQKVKINMDEPSDPGDEGVPYAFKSMQRVHKDHPAVKANPGAFIPADEVDEVDQVIG